MTRVILINKETGQELPEAELVNAGSSAYVIQFDGTGTNNSFYHEEWDYREVRTFRNGDVLRRKDRDECFVFYVYTEEGWGLVNWGSSISDITVAHISAESLDDLLNDPEWEMV